MSTSRFSVDTSGTSPGVGSPARRSRLLRLASAVGAAGVVLALSLPGQAEDDGGFLWGQGGCSSCHGNLAAGDGDAAMPAGPNLRRSSLDRDQLIETIACGRPGSEMPYNLAGAYTETSCYGLPLGDPPGVPAGARFTSDEVEALVDFLMEHVVGVRSITRENCALFFRGNMNYPACLRY